MYIVRALFFNLNYHGYKILGTAEKSWIPQKFNRATIKAYTLYYSNGNYSLSV